MMFEHKQILYLGVLFEIISCMSSNAKYPYIDVDEMLKRVMKSESFNELAEKIADKAVERLSVIKDLDIKHVTLDQPVAFPVSRVYEETTTEKQNKLIKRLFEDSSQEGKKKGIVPDATTNKRKDAMDLQKKLSLKFKRFTRSDANGDSKAKSKKDKLSDKQSSGTTLEPDSSVSMIKDKTTAKRVKIKTTSTVKPKRNKKGEDSDNSDSLNESEETTTKKKAVSKNSFQQDDSVEPDSLNKDYENDRKQHISEVSAKISEQKPYNDLFKLRAPKDSDESNNTDNEGLWGSDEHHKVMENITSSTKFHQSKSHIKGSEKLLETTKDVIRREGNKLYTYEKSPDYDEYHEEIARIQKKIDNDNDEDEITLL